MNSLADRLDSFAEAWKPEPGDKLMGRIVGLDKRVSAYDDEPYVIVTVEAEESSAEDGGKPIPAGAERAWHAFDTIPRNELKRQRPRIGQRIGAGYHGLHARGYKRWKIVVEAAGETAFDWDEVAGAETEPPNRPDSAEDDSLPF